MYQAILILALSAPASALAQGTRALDAHEHGTSALDIAVEGNRVAMALAAPGSDIVGFEYEAATAEDRAALDAGIVALSAPLSLFELPDAAGCTVISVRAGLVDEQEHDHEHGHEEDHAAENAGGGHTEFQARYMIDCADPAAIDRIGFAFFDRFPNARQVKVQLITDAGATRFDVTREAPVLDLSGRY